MRPPFVEAPELAEADGIYTCAQTGAVAKVENELRAGRKSEASSATHQMSVGHTSPLEAHQCAEVSGALAFLRADAKAVVSTAVWMIPEILLSVSRIGWYVTSNVPV